MVTSSTHNACVLLTCSREPADGSGLHGRLRVHQQQDSRQRLQQGAGGRLWLVTASTDSLLSVVTIVCNCNMYVTVAEISLPQYNLRQHFRTHYNEI